MSTPSDPSPTAVSVSEAGLWDAERIADVAAATFPLACPPDASSTDIAAFIDETLSAERFSEYLTDPNRIVLEATVDGDIVGYLMAVDEEPSDPAIDAVVSARPAIEISKLYVLPGRHGSGVSAALMNTLIDRGCRSGRAGLWLGVNQQNIRARKFYEKQGFEIVGTRTFTVGSGVHADYVMQRALP